MTWGKEEVITNYMELSEDPKGDWIRSSKPCHSVVQVICPRSSQSAVQSGSNTSRSSQLFSFFPRWRSLKKKLEIPLIFFKTHANWQSIPLLLFLEWWIPLGRLGNWTLWSTKDGNGVMPTLNFLTRLFWLSLRRESYHKRIDRFRLMFNEAFHNLLDSAIPISPQSWCHQCTSIDTRSGITCSV